MEEANVFHEEREKEKEKEEKEKEQENKRIALVDIPFRCDSPPQNSAKSGEERTGETYWEIRRKKTIYQRKSPL